jgi:predicted nucleic acid-binding protein
LPHRTEAIVADVNILSTFARVGEVKLLFALFPKAEIVVTPAVQFEIMAGVHQGFSFLEEVVSLIESGHLRLEALTKHELLEKQRIPATLGEGEAESIVLCQSRGWTLLMNDRRARNFAESVGLTVYDLRGLLRALWRYGIRSKKQVRQLADRMEAAENMVIKNKEALFKP